MFAANKRAAATRVAFLGLMALLVLSGCATPPVSYDARPTVAAFTDKGPFFVPEDSDAAPIWGIRGGIVVGIKPGVVGYAPHEKGGPRGLIRFGYEAEGRLYFINFAALTAVTTDGRYGKSELDRSPGDGARGMIIEAYPPAFHQDYDAWRERDAPPVDAAARVWRKDGFVRLSWVLRYEAFVNDARPYLLVTIREERPQEVEFQFFTEPGSPELEGCVLSPTFGNLTQLRVLHLANVDVTAAELWPDFRGRGFARPAFFKLPRLARDENGDVVLAARPDRIEPWKTRGYPHPRRLTQYLRKPRGSFDETLRGYVNGRYMFWKTTTPVPGGTAFENIALLERFREGTVLIFGYRDADE
ncbi:MAG: hypothetical protein P9L99_15585 [Candidatus Lernaella stagnicola]|nr:hypothetical protein [Candidatus Lernaella stagnicola]